MKKKKSFMIVPPRIKVTDAENGEIRMWTTKKTTPGIYELNFTNDNGEPLLKTPIRIEVA